MSSHHESRSSGPAQSELRRQLELTRGPATVEPYDVEAGLLRHRQLVARGTPTPAWAAGLGSVRPRPAIARWFTGLSALMVGTGALWLSQGPGEDPLAPRASTAAPADAEPASPVSVAVTSVPGAPSAPDAPPSVTAPVTAPAGEPVAATGVALESVPSDPAALAALPQGAPSAVSSAPAPSAPTAARASAARARRTPEARTSVVVPEPSLAELARQSIASAESAPSVPASRPSVHGPAAAARSGAPAGEASPARSQAVPPHLAIEAERPGVVAEMQELSRAEALVGRDPAAALKLVQASMADHPHGYLAEERRYVQVLALLGLRRVEEARLLGREFSRLYPQSPYRRRIEAAIATALRVQ